MLVYQRVSEKHIVTKFLMTNFNGEFFMINPNDMDISKKRHLVLPEIYAWNFHEHFVCSNPTFSGWNFFSRSWSADPCYVHLHVVLIEASRCLVCTSQNCRKHQSHRSRMIRNRAFETIIFFSERASLF